jgi:hypothetical protein
MALGFMAAPDKQKAPRGVRGAGSEGWDSGQVPRRLACVVLFPVVLKVRETPWPPMQTGEMEAGFIGNNMYHIILESLKKSTRIRPGQALHAAS